MAESEGPFVLIFIVPTIESYWLYTHCFEEIFGCEIKNLATTFKSLGSSIWSMVNFLNSAKYSGSLNSLIYTGAPPPKTNELAGTSATRLEFI